MRKLLRKKLNNRGNTFIVILVAIACMGILIGVIMASMGYFYRMRFVDLENKNNFYYVEKAMDDIYTGIGSDSVTELMRAYESTVEVMVYYDTVAGRFVTIDEASANEIMKQKFLRNLVESDKYKSQQDLYNSLSSFISVSDVTLVNPASLSADQPRLYLEVVTATDAAGKTTYDKLVIHNVTVTRTTDEGYVQSITTDIEIAEPEFNVSFSNVDGNTNALYSFAMIADMGVEFDRATQANQAISITGNIYAAADYYNKEYNQTVGTRVSSYYGGTTTDERLNACDGWKEKSRYSGIYVNATNVNIMANTVIVPGSLSVMNDAKVSIIGDRISGDGYSNVWADNIVMAPSYVRTTGMKFGGGALSMYANAYVADDFEINEDNAAVELAGNYYGYNFSQTSDTERVLSQYAQNSKAHYNSSAIIVNGNAANLDFSGLKELYVAGRSYISTSTIRQSSVAADGTSATVSYVEVDNGTDTRNVDVRTGESISVKTNQMAYMPMGIYEDSNGEQIPKFTNDNLGLNRTIYNYMQDPSRDWLANPAVVSQSVAGNTYYFLNFKSARAASEFLSWYVDKENGISKLPGYEITNDIVDITAYTDNLADINLGSGSDAVRVTTSGAYTTGVVNVAQGRRLSVNVPGFNGDIINGGSESATITNFNTKATEYNNNYMEMKYTLELIDVDEDSTPYAGDKLTEMTALKNSIATKTAETVTPINYYLDMTKVDGDGWASGIQVGNAYVWISNGDVTITAPSGTNGNVLGLIIAKGDVTFLDNPVATGDEVKRFEGLIISGSKIKVDHPMDFVANPELVKTILRTADATKGNSSGDYSGICEIFRDYSANTSTSDPNTTNVGNIELGDILRYNNWKKNVE
ncbi:MAG: hypothetical protein NC089_04245 [Bacteroides sp.]|nr:hypothetical protein [Bacteroides sp.]MCM1548604.1 hypothetical protein [Clostridium sp.]